MLRLQHVSSRSAGVLLHITSLPSPFGMGDMGPAARAFADFLYKSHQQWWQILPINPTDRCAYPSPYSSFSSMAGNTMLLSPEDMVQDKLLTKEDLKPYLQPSSGQADFNDAYKVKSALFQKAYASFKSGRNKVLEKEYYAFCELESHWLNDFALFLALKEHHHTHAWQHWPEAYKDRDPEALAQFSAEQEYALSHIKWLQFMFARQWKNLKAYCHERRVYFFGDLPFYVSHDSADVWAHRDIFSLDKDGNITAMAGVPPDYFSKTGQLWGMPVFRWEVLKERKYDWWVRRIERNIELFDLLRLDHFRAFALYWSVPSGEQTAVNGQWMKGPGMDLFRAIEKKSGGLPFVAEDLGGETDEPVQQLRDELGLPGLKILQFAFGEDMPGSLHSPHNYTPEYVVYTGNHDTNTTVGWYRLECNHQDRQRLKEYTGKKVTEKNVHDVMAQMAYASVARIVILPMQDLLALNETERMNTPGSTQHNWTWRLKEGQIKKSLIQKLKNWTGIYNRE